MVFKDPLPGALRIACGLPPIPPDDWRGLDNMERILSIIADLKRDVPYVTIPNGGKFLLGKLDCLAEWVQKERVRQRHARFVSMGSSIAPPGTTA